MASRAFRSPKDSTAGNLAHSSFKALTRSGMESFAPSFPKASTAAYRTFSSGSSRAFRKASSASRRPVLPRMFAAKMRTSGSLSERLISSCLSAGRPIFDRISMVREREPGSSSLSRSTSFSMIRSSQVPARIPATADLTRKLGSDRPSMSIEYPFAMPRSPISR